MTSAILCNSIQTRKSFDEHLKSDEKFSIPFSSSYEDYLFLSTAVIWPLVYSFPILIENDFDVEFIDFKFVVGVAFCSSSHGETWVNIYSTGGCRSVVALSSIYMIVCCVAATINSLHRTAWMYGLRTSEKEKCCKRNLNNWSWLFWQVCTKM